MSMTATRHTYIYIIVCSKHKMFYTYSAGIVQVVPNDCCMSAQRERRLGHFTHVGATAGYFGNQNVVDY
jgi:hypothetical protein